MRFLKIYLLLKFYKNAFPDFSHNFTISKHKKYFDNFFYFNLFETIHERIKVPKSVLLFASPKRTVAIAE